MKELTPRQKKSLDMKKNIYEVFYRLCKEYEGKVTVKDVCREAGVSVGSFYNFFESKEAVTSAVYQYLNDEMRDYEYPREPMERIMAAAERLMSLSIEKGLHFLKMAAIYEMDHTPSIVKSSYDGQVLFSATADIIISALEDGAEKGIFSLEHPAWYYSDMIIFMHRSQLYFWTVNNGHYDPLSAQLSYTEFILDSIKAKGRS